jgi:rSAM/selenodomain-associated transferase 1
MTERATVVLFVRSPERGKVKSRLASAMGQDSALELYRAFVLDIVGMLRRGDVPLTIAFHPADSGKVLISWLGENFAYIPQRGEDLGKRMENAFTDSFSRGFGRVVLIGSDIPDLTSAVMDEAFSSLEENDAVIGPAADGGYYLIGFKASTFSPEIFHNIPWGTGSVFGVTMKMFGDRGLRVHVLPAWDDVDTLDDLQALFMRNRNTRFSESSTMSFCRKVFHG